MRIKIFGRMHTRRSCVLLTAFTVVAFCFLVSTTKYRLVKNLDDIHKYDKVTDIKIPNKVISRTVPDTSTQKTTTRQTTTKSTTTTTTTSQIPWIEKADSMHNIQEKKLRCKTQYLGCFVALNKTTNREAIFTEYKMKDSENFKESCMDKCFSSNNHLAGYSNRMKSCVCSSTFHGFISVPKKGKWASAAWDETSRCRNSKTYQVYDVIRRCERGARESKMQDDLVGCIDMPKELRGIMIALAIPELKTEQCMLNCELRGFTYAVPALKYDVCICSDSYSLFHNADNMLNMMKACNKRGGDKRVPVYRTVIEDQHCRRKFLNKGQAPPILLASYYGSGNTWIRHLIEVSTGIYTGSVFKDIYLYEGGMLGEMNAYDSGRTIAVKDHLFKLQLKPGYRMAILLLRNPYDATLAEWSRRSTKNHTGVTDPKAFKSPAFRKYAEKRPSYWGGIVKTVLKSIDKVLVIYYEDLKENAVKQMRRLAKFLPDDLVPSEGEALERQLMCMNLDIVGQFKRPPRNLDFDPFTAFQRNNYDKTIREIDDLLIKYKQPPLKDNYFLPF